MPMSPEELRKGGNWVVELKVILKKGTAVGNRPGNEHRSTKKAVTLLLSNLRVGVGKTPDPKDALTSAEEYERFRKVIFNSVDMLIADKTDKSKKGKTKLEALEKFQQVLDEQFEEEAKKKSDALKSDWKYKIEEAINGLKHEEMDRLYQAGKIPALDMLDMAVLAARPGLRGKVLKELDPATLSENKKNQWFQEAENAIKTGGVKPEELLGTDLGRKLFAEKKHLRGATLAALDPAKVDDLDLDQIFGSEKNDILTDALLAMTEKTVPKSDSAPNAGTMDPALFSKLKTKFAPDKWNESSRGLGARVCQGLWQKGHYDQIAELIDYGVDTSLAARVAGKTGSGAGVYSGFFQPVQHVVSKHLRDVSVLDIDPCPLTDDRKWRAKGAKKVIAALEKKDAAKTVTKWSDVTGSEMMVEFKKKPGTIWGFEDIRLPFVQAAHGVDEVPAQPLRMMELWEAVNESLDPAAFARLLDDPDKAADEFVKKGIEIIEAGLKSTKPSDVAKYDEIRKKKDEFIGNFRTQAKEFLKEFASQMPKATFTTGAKDESGKVRREKTERGDEVDVGLSDVAGVQKGKFAGGLACKAGLWWAKKENKPVYYCLDGINMDDVTNYKKAKNKSIEDFIAAGGKTKGAKGHDEVITMVELREVLKNWDELKDTVLFVLKGKILKDDELKSQVAEWQNKLKDGNRQAGRTPAPPREDFTYQLNAINPKLMQDLSPGKEGNMDARDIVKKYGYLLKVSKTRPAILLKYIISRCAVLTKYKLLSDGLAPAAAQFNAPKEGDDMKALSAELLRQIKLCYAALQGPLESALTRHESFVKA
jgi:hypothetical protein